jgi:hypothetical protein
MAPAHGVGGYTQELPSALLAHSMHTPPRVLFDVVEEPPHVEVLPSGRRWLRGHVPTLSDDGAGVLPCRRRLGYMGSEPCLTRSEEV